MFPSFCCFSVSCASETLPCELLLACTLCFCSHLKLDPERPSEEVKDFPDCDGLWLKKMKFRLR